MYLKNDLVLVKYYPFGTKHYEVILVKRDDIAIIKMLNQFNKRQANRDAYAWKNICIVKEHRYMDVLSATADGDNPEDSYIRNYIKKKLDCFIETLTPQQRIVIVELLANDFDFYKVAIILNRTDVGIRDVYHRALRSLKRKFISEFGRDFNFNKYINN